MYAYLKKHPNPAEKAKLKLFTYSIKAKGLLLT